MPPPVNAVPITTADDLETSGMAGAGMMITNSYSTGPIRATVPPRPSTRWSCPPRERSRRSARAARPGVGLSR
jgi:hypothetical protein